MAKPLTVSEAARLIRAHTGWDIPPQVISGLFYRRKLDNDRCPIAGRVRLIPPDYIAVIEATLRAEGHLPAEVSLASVSQEGGRP